MSRTFSTLEEAIQWADAIEKRMAAGAPSVDGVITLNTPVRDIVARYMREVSPTKRGAQPEVSRLGNLLERFTIFDKTLGEFGPEDIKVIRDARLAGSKHYCKVSNLTVIREMGNLSGVFTHAISEWSAPLKENPVHLITKPKAPRGRNVRISDDETAAILAWADFTPGEQPDNARRWVAFGYLLAIESAMRRGELLGIRWRDVQLDDDYVHLSKTKNDESRDVPLSPLAHQLISSLERGNPDDLIFGVSYHYFGKVWQQGRRENGWKFRFHDCRHEATTRIADMVPTVMHLGAITGHRDLRSLQIYFNPKAKRLAQFLKAKAG
jgi:integrase